VIFYLISKYRKNAHDLHDLHDLNRLRDHIGGVNHEIMKIMCMKYRGGGGVYFFWKILKTLMIYMIYMI
jgi:hypothetical protein